MDTITEEIVTSTESTTEFVEDKIMVINESYSRPDGYSDIAISDASIKDFLAKPYLVASGSGASGWLDSDAAGVVLESASIKSLLTANTYWMKKIYGYNLFRGTACFRIVINASPFCQGRALFHVLPLATDNAADPSYAAMHNATLCARTMQPGIEFGTGDGGGVLKIPYVAPSYFYDFGLDTYDWGTYYFVVLSPLLFGAASTVHGVDYSIYLHFEDVEIAAPMLEQSNTHFFDVFEDQAKKGKFSASVGSKEAAATSDKPISGMLAIGSSVASTLSAIPVLSAVAGPAAWALDLASGVASAFGWSKPVSEDMGQVVAVHPNRYTATSDGVDFAVPLALTALNKTEFTGDMSIRDVDEMSWNYLKKQSALITDFNWAMSTAQGTGLIVGGLNIHPRNLYVTGTQTAGAHVSTYRQGPPVYYLSQFFQLYRGSFEITLKFVKTEFHTGRLQVTWTPSRTAVFTEPTILTGQQSLREIIDISVSNEVKLTLPWIQHVDYVDMETNSGWLSILVLNELRAPDSVADNINVLMYVNGGDDLEYQVPSSVKYNIFSPQSNPAFSDCFVDQSSSDFTGGTDMAVNTVVGNYPTKSQDTTHSVQCIGEHFTSIKQLLNRYTNVYQKGVYVASSYQTDIWPWFVGNTSVAAAGLTGGPAGADAYSILAPMYVTFKGSVKISIEPLKASTVTVPDFMTACLGNILHVSPTAVITQSTTPRNLPLSDATWWTTVGNSISGISHNVGAGISYLVPYYCRTRFSLVRTQPLTTSGIPAGDSQPITTLTCSSPSAFTGMNYRRAMADDFRLAYFIGCPPVVISTT